MALIWRVESESAPKCGAQSSKSNRAMACELPPDHVCGEVHFDFHYGRDRRGYWRAWGRKSEANALLTFSDDNGREWMAAVVIGPLVSGKDTIQLEETKGKGFRLHRMVAIDKE